MPSRAGAAASAAARRRSDRGEIGRPALAAVTVAPLSFASLARSAKLHPRRANSRVRTVGRTAMPITGYRAQSNPAPTGDSMSADSRA